MSILIAYATKGGATKECAELLAAEIGDCTICDLKEGAPNVDDLDIVILGSGIRIGKAYKPFGKFIDENTDALLTKKIAFFFSNKLVNEFSEVVKKNIPQRLKDTAFIVKTFGGRPVFGGKKDQNWMLRDEVIAFADVVKALVK
jgi:menaquinone-dependent protoporphyrinogen oxidase